MQRLVQMAQQPDGLFPQYLVLTELERRNRYKQAYDAEKASMVGDTTVAQDLVNESASEPIDARKTWYPMHTTTTKT